MLLLKKILYIAATVLTWALYLLALTSGYGGFIDPEVTVIPGILTLVFLPLFVLTLIPAALWLIFRRRRPIALAGIAVVVLLLYPFFTVSPLSFPSGPKPGEKVLKVLTYNVHHFARSAKDSTRTEIVDYLLRSDADVICLQEACVFTYFRYPPETTHPMFSHELGRKYPYMRWGTDNEMAILSRYPLSWEGPLAKIHDQCAVAAEAQVEPGKSVTVFCVHFPSYRLSDDEKGVVTQLDRGFDGMKKSAREMKRSILGKLKRAALARASFAAGIDSVASLIPGRQIVCGDFNDVPLSYTWRLFNSSGFRDAYVDAGNGPMYTFNAFHMLFHIDQILYRGDMRAVSVEKGRLKASDHYPVSATFVIR